MSSKFIPNSRITHKPQTWEWSSKPYSKAERKKKKKTESYRDKMESEKQRIQAIPLEKLSFRDLYTEPFKDTSRIGWVYSGNNFVFQFLSDNDETNKKCLQILNGELLEYNRHDVKHLNGEILVNDRPFILIRGWGNLTGGGAYNLDAEYASKIQDSLAEFIVEKLSK